MMGLHTLVALVLLVPVAAVALLGLPAWFGHVWPERPVHTITTAAFGLATLATLVAVVWMAATGVTEVRVPLGTWFSVSEYTFQWELVADRLSLPIALFAAALVGLISVFSQRYLHREPGFTRFYILLALFGAAVVLVVLAGDLALIFVGWEMVGVSSALLIAYFHERRAPVVHGLRAFITYRLCDIGLLAAVVWLHHSQGTTALTSEPGDNWAGIGAGIHGTEALALGALVLWASMGKAAQVPFGGWLPRAMEGPTPSSAIFYGALSIHLGPYLLLRALPLFHNAPLVGWMVVAVGGLTALHGTFVGRAQTDIKSLLAYASMTQVGLIYVEIGLGFHYLALVHIIGHAAVRSLQILRAPSLLHDHSHLEQAVGNVLPRTGGHLERLVPSGLQPWLYRHALERGYFDAILRDYVVGPVMWVLLRIDTVERRWANWLGGAGEDRS